MTMFDVIGLSALVDFAYAAIGVTAGFFGLRYLDRRAEASKWKPWAIMQENPNALAIYLAGRFFGLCYLVGAIVG